MEYRAADIHDLLPISIMWNKLMIEIFDGVVEVDRAELEAFAFNMSDRLRSPKTATFVATDDGRIVGFTHGYVMDKPFGKPRAVGFSEFTYVLPEFREKGVGAKLLEMSIEQARSLGLQQFEMITKYDTSLVDVWAKMGFKPIAILFRGGE